jgi:hypothetical protein
MSDELKTKPPRRYGPRRKTKRFWQGRAKYPVLEGKPTLTVVLLI